VGTSRFVALGEADLNTAPASLGPLSTIGLAPDELARLADGSRMGVISWINSGGTLLVDAPSGTTVPGLPQEWQPGPTGVITAGQGRVRLTDGAMASGRWNALVEPTGWGLSASTASQAAGSLSGALASESGLQVPTPGWLVAFLALYVLLVGPLGFFVLRRRQRPEVAWVAIPLVALLFTGTSFVAGRNLRNEAALIHASVLDTGSRGSVVWTGVGVFSRSGGTVTVGMPSDWTPAETATAGQNGQARVASVTRTAQDSRARLPLDTGEYGLVVGHGSPRIEGQLVVTAESNQDRRAKGTVRNTTQFVLDQVAVFAGSGGTLVGRLGPGQVRDWFLEDPGNGAFEGPPDYRIWESNANGAQAPVSFALWDAARLVTGVDFRSPGSVVAAGWTQQFVPPIT
ncbi:MAG: hypothetical protein ACRDRT_12435, partial [Pseudonocardiaceae bacterium]